MTDGQRTYGGLKTNQTVIKFTDQSVEPLIEKTLKQHGQLNFFF